MACFQKILIKTKTNDVNSYHRVLALSKENKWFVKRNDILVPIYLGDIYLSDSMDPCDTYNRGNKVTLEEIIVENQEHYHFAQYNDEIINWVYERYNLHCEFERVLKYAIDSSKLDTTASDSELLKFSGSFNFDNFKHVFPAFDQFLQKASHLNIMVAGSSVLYAHTKKLPHHDFIFRCKYHPNDIDLYIHATADQKQTLLAIDTIIREIYLGHKIKIIRSPYVLTYFVFGSCSRERREIVIVSYQIILSPCKRWEHVFAGYHSDIVCAGYLCSEEKFVTTTRFDYWASNQMLPAYFFPDLVSPRYRDRVAQACEKYRLREFNTVLVSPFDELKLMDIERSPKLETIFSCENDIAPYLQKLDDICSIGDTLQEVYHGETFQSIIETMACFRSCPVCATLVFCAERALYCDLIQNQKHFDSGCFCQTCFQKELDNLNLLEVTLRTKINEDFMALVTGARCGLGKEIMNLLEDNGIQHLEPQDFQWMIN